jgi:hypothetical protein
MMPKLQKVNWPDSACLHTDGLIFSWEHYKTQLPLISICRFKHIPLENTNLCPKYSIYCPFPVVPIKRMAEFLMLSFRRMVIDRHGLYSVIVKHGLLVELRVFFFQIPQSRSTGEDPEH